MEDVVRDKFDSRSFSSDLDDERDNVVPSKKHLHEEVPKEIDVKRIDVIVVEEPAKEPTDPDKGVLEKMTGIFKSDRSISSSRSASEEDIPIVKPTSSMDKVLSDKSESSSSSSDSDDDDEKVLPSKQDSPKEVKIHLLKSIL